jgi:hypothetical protein
MMTSLAPPYSLHTVLLKFESYTPGRQGYEAFPLSPELCPDEFEPEVRRCPPIFSRLYGGCMVLLKMSSSLVPGVVT